MNNGVGSFSEGSITFGCFLAVCIFIRQLRLIIQGDFLALFRLSGLTFVATHFLNRLLTYFRCFILHFSFKLNFISFIFYRFDPNLKLFQLFSLRFPFILVFFVAIVYRVKLKHISCSKCL
jgi:hypothetical protein